MKNILVDNLNVNITGRVLRTGRLGAEYYETISNPEGFVQLLKAVPGRPDLFTFVQTVSDRAPRFGFHQEWDYVSVLPITSYEHWWKKTIRDKTRNMVRKASKAGVTIRVVEFDDQLVNGIMAIYNETPIRQGKPFRHYGKDFQTLKESHSTFLDRSEFIGAYLGNDLIGFVKLVHGNGFSNVMQILSMISHRDKAPTNALLAKTVEICANRGVPQLHYGMFSRRGIGDFKAHHGFEKLAVPRYYVPLSMKGQLFLRSGLHRPIPDYVPEKWLDRVWDLRSKWNAMKHRNQKSAPAQPNVARANAV